jgi:hypothetical protein
MLASNPDRGVVNGGSAPAAAFGDASALLTGDSGGLRPSGGLPGDELETADVLAEGGGGGGGGGDVRSPMVRSSSVTSRNARGGVEGDGAARPVGVVEGDQCHALPTP